MRKKDKEIRDWSRIEHILQNNKICRLGLCRKGRPYIVPVNYGYKDRTIFIHTGKIGKKMDIIRENPNVCVEIDQDIEIIRGEVPCKFSTKYDSVIADGRAEIIEDVVRKQKALDIIMTQLCGKRRWIYEQSPLKHV